MNLHGILIHVLHIFIIAPLFLYVGIVQNKIPAFLFSVLFYLGIYTILFHSWKAYLKLTQKQNPWVNLIHILLVGPLLIYIGYKNNKTPRYCYELLMLLAFAALGYHAYYLITGFY